MRDKWKIENPEILIDIKGGADDFPLIGPCKEFLRRTLIGQALSTGLNTGDASLDKLMVKDVWIVSRGTYSGVIKQVGKAVRDHVHVKRHKFQGALIGIAPWKTAATHLQKNKSSDGTLNYSMKDTAYLEPNHTHFILVDSGMDESGGEVYPEFRNHFINYLSESNTSKIKFNMCVLLEGGVQCLEHVQFVASVGTRVIVIGQLADVLCKVFDLDRQQKPWEAYAKSKANIILGSDQEEFDINNLLRECIRLKDTFLFHRLSNDSNSQKNIIYTIIRDSHVGWKDQMKQALLRNRPDIATEILEDESVCWQSSVDLFPFFIYAVRRNKVQFVNLFLNHHVLVSKPLTTDDMKALYKGDGVSSQNIISRDQLKDYVTQQYPDKFGDQFQELFICAVLRNEMEMAELFWGYSREPLAAALTATSLLQAMSSSYRLRRKLPDECEDMESSAKRMEELATGLLTEYRGNNLRNTASALRVHRPNWGDSCFKIGLSGCPKLDFASHSSVQDILDEVWWGDVVKPNQQWKARLVFFFPILLLIEDFIQFKPNDATEKDDIVEEGVGESTDNRSSETAATKLSFLEKLIHFYTRSPKVKFKLHWISYVTFLLYMSYVMLFEFRKNMAIAEMVLIGWVCTFAFEGVRQIVDADGTSLKKKLEAYVQEPWKLLDISSLCCFFFGTLLRCFPNVLLDSARIMLCLSLILFYVKSLRIFLCYKKVGPKLLMIGRMVVDLALFVGIMAVFLLAYGVASQAILYPNYTENFVEAVRQVILKSYFQIFGELFLDSIQGRDDCTKNVTMIKEGYPPCPENSWAGVLLLGGYMLISNVLLLNLLIAMFTFTFEQVQENTDRLWKYHRNELILEYARKPFLAPPFVMLPLTVRLVKNACGNRAREMNMNGSHNAMNDTGEADNAERTVETLTPTLERWEKMMLRDYLTKLNKKKEGNITDQLQLLNKRFDRLECIVNNNQ